MSAFEKLAARPHLTGPKRQHHLPEFYLKGFCEGDLLTVFDRHSREIRRQAPVDTGVVRYLYTFTDAQDRRRYDLEVMFATTESLASPLLAALDAGAELTAAEMDPLVGFLALMALRTPTAIERFQVELSDRLKDKLRGACVSEEAVVEILRNDPEFANDPELVNLARAAFEVIRGADFDIQVHRDEALRETMKQFRKLAVALHDRDFVALYTSDASSQFLTTDVPVVLERRGSAIDVASLNFNSPGAMFLFPVSKRCALEISGNGQRFGRRVLPPAEVARFNRMVVQHADRFVVGPTAAAIEQAIQA